MVRRPAGLNLCADEAFFHPVRAPATIRGNDRDMARPRTSPQPEVPGLAARRIAADILDGVLRRKIALDEQLSGKTAHTGLATLADRDRALMRRLTATVLRRLGTLRHLLGGFLDKGFPSEAPRVETILLIGAAQILWLEVPDHAAVDLSVRLAQADRRAARYAGLINAVLRRVTQSKTAALANNATRDTPKWLVARWTKRYGAETARAIAHANGHEPALDLTVKHDAGVLGRAPARARVADRNRAHLRAGRDLAAAGLQRRRLVGAGRRRVAARPPARRRARQSGRRSVRGARRQDRAARVRRRAGHRGRSLAGAAQPPARKSDAACAASRDRRRRCAGMARRAVRRRAARCALLLDRHHPPPPRRTLAQERSRHRRADILAAAAARPRDRSAQARRHAWSIASARWNRRKPRTRSRRCWRATRASPARLLQRKRSPATPNSSPRTATCARCRRNCPTPIRAGAGSMDSMPPGSPAKPSAGRAYWTFGDPSLSCGLCARIGPRRRGRAPS